eukprot:6345643-Amphidinium_carterae.1
MAGTPKLQVTNGMVRSACAPIKRKQRHHTLCTGTGESDQMAHTQFRHGASTSSRCPPSRSLGRQLLELPRFVAVVDQSQKAP